MSRRGKEGAEKNIVMRFVAGARESDVPRKLLYHRFLLRARYMRCDDFEIPRRAVRIAVHFALYSVRPLEPRGSNEGLNFSSDELYKQENVLFRKTILYNFSMIVQ